MQKKLDLRGKSCPQPVILTKKELDNMQEGILISIVDNQVAMNNVSKLITSLGYDFTVDEDANGDYHINIKIGKGQVVEESLPKEINKSLEDLVIGIGSNKMGSGEEELGRILMKSFIYTVRETKPFPSNIVLYNSGVYLTCEGSEVLDDLKALEDEGVEILSCGTCLDYYKINDKLKVGGITNMYTIYETMRNGNNILNIG